MMSGSNASESFITHLQCSECGKTVDHRVLQTVCPSCGKMLLARYDLDRACRVLSRDPRGDRPQTMWRQRELLPLLAGTNMVSLGEGFTPLLHLKRLGGMLGLDNLVMKDESFNPTGSFKARGLSMAVSKAKELGVKEVCMPTAGNAGAALAAYAAVAGMATHIFMPDDTPRVNIDECRVYGADVHLVPGTISDAARAMNAGKQDWFDMSTLKEPYRLEGKKTLGFELAEQCGWELPDVVVYPTGGGTGLIGMWKAFDEMGQLGWIDGRKKPRMVTVQSKGCAPVVLAFASGKGVTEPWDKASTVASGLRVPNPFAGSLMLRILHESKGDAVAVDDGEILRAVSSVAALEGVLMSPEGAATAAALPVLKDRGMIRKNSRVLIFNTASGLKYSEVLNRLAAQQTASRSVDSV